MDFTKSNEWYTPPRYLEAARAVMGGIDLDPASSTDANRLVKATTYYTREQNGLSHPWFGRVWLNPPYGRSAKMQGQGRSTIKMFVDKCLDAYRQGEIEQATLLVTTEVNAKWFYPLWRYPICFPDHRINFLVAKLPQSKKYSQMFGSCFVYLGPNEELFIEVFSQFGIIAKRVSQPRKALYTTLDLFASLADPGMCDDVEGGVA